jgi:hypothetical protein
MIKYLASGEWIDWRHPEVLSKAKALANGVDDKNQLAKACFEFVRDEIKHCGDYKLNWNSRSYIIMGIKQPIEILKQEIKTLNDQLDDQLVWYESESALYQIGVEIVSKEEKLICKEENQSLSQITNKETSLPG